MWDKVQDVVKILRPSIQADGGDIDLVEVNDDTGVVTVRLSGTCVSCPASSGTLEAGIERILIDRVPEVTEVRQRDEDDLVSGPGTAVSL